jgi:Flp pilus assembly protein TadD
MPPNSEIEKLERRWKENPKGTVFAPYAEVLRKNADYSLAMEVLRQGLLLHPDHIPGNIVLGRCSLDAGQDGQAEAAFSHVLELDAENVIALKALAEITERQGRLAEAHNWLTRLIAVDPSNEEARDQLARVRQTQEAAASEGSPAAVAPGTPEVIEPSVVRGEPRVEPPRAEVGAGEIADTGERPAAAGPTADYAAAAEEALDEFLAPSVKEPPPPPSPPAWTPAPGLVPSAAAAPAPPAPEPVAGLESREFDLSSVTEELDRLEDVDVHEPFSPPAPEPASFSIGVEQREEIELRPSGSTEFQAPDDSEALLHLASGGRSEYQVPDAAEELKLSGSAASEYQTPSGAEELLRSALAAQQPAAAPEAEAPPPPAAVGETREPDLELLASMPTQEMTTPPPIPALPVEQTPPAPSWLFEEEAEPAADASAAPAAAPVEEAPEPESVAPEVVSAAAEPEARTEMTEPEPVASEPEPVAGEPEPAVTEPEPVELEAAAAAAEVPAFEPEPEPEPAAAGAPELKLIFPDEQGEEAPPRRRITEEVARPLMAGETEPEPAVMDPAPVMTETMAELYARQGHLNEALRVYRALAERQPNDARLRQRIQELEARSASTAPRRMTYAAAETGGESVESFFRALAQARPGGAGAERPDEEAGAAPTRPASDPLSLSAIFGEEPAASAAPAGSPPEPGRSIRPPAGPDAFSFDQFFGGPAAGGTPGSSSPARPAGPSDEDLDQFQHWLKSLKR